MKKNFMFKSLRVVIVLITAAVIAILLITLRPKAKRIDSTEPGILVEAATVKVENLNMIVESYGTVKPRETLKLVAEVKGRIVEISPSFREGGFIKKGTNLIKIDPRTYQLEVKRRKVQIDQIKAEIRQLRQEIENLKASMKIAASDVSLAKAEFFRLKKLMGKNVVAKTTLDKADQKYLASVDRLQQLENQMALTGPLEEKLKAQQDMAVVLLHQAELDLEKTRIIAPFDAWVLEKAIEKGLNVKFDQYLGAIYSIGALDVEVRIPVNDLKWLPHHLTAKTMPEAEIFFSSETTSASWKGTVARTLARMDEKTRTLPVVIEVDLAEIPSENSGLLQLRPGMFVNVKIKGKKIDQVFVLPRHVVHDGDTVYIVNGNRLKIRSVNVLRRFKDTVFVDKGLSDGEQVIYTPLSGAEDGMQIRLKSEKSGHL